MSALAECPKRTKTWSWIKSDGAGLGKGSLTGSDERSSKERVGGRLAEEEAGKTMSFLGPTAK